MGCLFDCFRAAGGEPRAGRARAQLVSSAVIPKVGEIRAAAPSRNALSAVFLREDEGSSQATSQDVERRRADRELAHEATALKTGGTPLENPSEIRKGPESKDLVYENATHSARLPALSENMHFVDVLKTEDCQTPLESHPSSYIPDATSSPWKGCDASNLHDSEAVSKAEDYNGVRKESVTDCDIKLSTVDSCSFSSNNDDIYLEGSKLSLFSTPSKVNAEIHTPATNAPNLEGLGNGNSSQHLSEVPNPAGDSPNCEAFSENFFQPNISDKDLKCAKDGSLVSIELSMSDECSLFQNSEGSVSSCNKINNSMSTPCEEKCQTTDVTVHASRKKVITNGGSDMEFPSLSQWLKPPNSRTSDTAKSSDDDRPIIGMVAAHWKNEEPENLSPQWWDGNGIPNSTNKYKEDQKVSWHAMSFEERLEKALSEEKLLSQRKCSTGNTSQFSGVEGEESDTAASNHLRVAAFT